MKLLKKIALLLMVLTIPLSMTSCKNVRVEDIHTISIINCEMEDYDDAIADVEYASEFMPALSDLSEYTNISYSYKDTISGLILLLPMFEICGITLFVEYSEDIYEQKKAETLAKYEFISEETYEYYEHLQAPLPQFEYKGYTFQADTNEEKTGDALKSFVLVGYNDETNKIAYCYFYDFDIDLWPVEGDYITAMRQFMDEHFYWNDVA